MTSRDEFLSTDNASDLRRLSLQAGVWQPHAEAMLDEIGIQPGWRCADLGCGAVGILEPLSRRVGESGHVVGVDTDAIQVAAAREAARDRPLDNVEILERDAYDTRLPRGSFDLVHVRFLFAPLGRDATLLREMLSLVRPGGIVAIQEPDSSSWTCWPPTDAWDRLKRAILEAFRRGGGDFDAGRRTFGMLQNLGLERICMRAGVVALPPGDPYRCVPIQFARSLRSRLIESGIISADELERALADFARVVEDRQTMMTSFLVMQAWGHKPM